MEGHLEVTHPVGFQHLHRDGQHVTVTLQQKEGPSHFIPKAGLRWRSLLVKHLNFVILLRPAALVDWDSVRSTYSCSPRAEIYLMRKVGMIVRGGTSLFFLARPELEVQGTSPNEPEPVKTTLL